MKPRKKTKLFIKRLAWQFCSQSLPLSRLGYCSNYIFFFGSRLSKMFIHNPSKGIPKSADFLFYSKKGFDWCECLKEQRRTNITVFSQALIINAVSARGLSSFWFVLWNVNWNDKQQVKSSQVKQGSTGLQKYYHCIIGILMILHRLMKECAEGTFSR